MEIVCLVLEGNVLGVVTKINRGYISCGSVQVEGTFPWFIQREQGRVHPLWIFACKGFYKVIGNLKKQWLLGDWM